MFTIPITVTGVDQHCEIDWKVIDSCIQHVKLKILTFCNVINTLEMKSSDSALFPCFGFEREANKAKERHIKQLTFDFAGNGGKYFYKNLRPMWDLKQRLEDTSNRPKDVKEVEELKANEETKVAVSKYTSKKSKWQELKHRKKRMINRNSFIGFYRHQYGYSAANNEFLFSLNKLTTPKENISREKQQVSISFFTYNVL